MKKCECLSKEEVAKELNTDFERGLSKEEALKRISTYGKNELVEQKKKSWIKIFFKELNDPLIFVLFLAIVFMIVISIYDTINCIRSGGNFSFINTGDWPDVIIILLVILLNAIIGTMEEIKANNSLEALKKISSPMSLVLRDGKKVKIKSSDLTIGDIVIIEDGDTIGADIRLIESVNLKVNESSLTGESLPVEKNADIVVKSDTPIGDRVNYCYQSTSVVYGRGIGVVCNVGMNTEIGRIAHVISETDEAKTPLQKILAHLSKILGYLTLGIVIGVLIIDIIWIIVLGNGSNIESYLEALLSSISLAVAAVPEGLAAVVTIVLAIGVERMVKVNTIVRKLPSVETLGAVSVICSDKTGTLTQNKMTVLNSYMFNYYYEQNDFKENNESLKNLAIGFSLCSNASIDDGNVFGDPTEIALIEFLSKFNLTKKEIEEKYPRVEELPFDSIRKMMTTRNICDGKSICYTKGSLDSILKYANRILDNGIVREITDNDIKKINEANSRFASKALRVLALAYNTNDSILERNLIFIGLVAMIDPPRPEALPAVLSLKKAGITTVMITGDHKDTAFEVAKSLGICKTKDECITGSEIDNLKEEELMEICKKVRVFARVSPENKVEIVKSFKRLGNICAMTGDGVNDAPSLKSADIGIAMGITGTDVAKSAADMVLADDNFASIEKAVYEGRGIYENIKKTVYFLLGSNMAEVFAMFLLILIGLPAPLIAIHLLWVNLITDSLPAIALGMQRNDCSIMEEKPRNTKESIFARGGLFLTLGYGLVVTVGVILAYFSCGLLNGARSFLEIKKLYMNNSEVLHQAQTMAFTTLAFSELFHMLGISNIKKSIINIFKNKNIMMFIAFFVGIILQISVIKIPGISDVFQTFNLNGIEWVITILLSLLPIIVHELVVLINYIRKRRN